MFPLQIYTWIVSWTASKWHWDIQNCIYYICMYLHMIHVHHVHTFKIYIIHSCKNLIGEVPLEVACRSHSWLASTSTHGQSWLWGILEFLARCGTQDNHHSCDSGCWKVAGLVYHIPKPRYQKTRVINDIHGTNWQQRDDWYDCMLPSTRFYNHKKTSTGST